MSAVFYRNKRNFLNEVTLRFFFSAYMKLIHRCLELQFIPKVFEVTVQYHLFAEQAEDFF